jgi:hypothetical protein
MWARWAPLPMAISVPIEKLLPRQVILEVDTLLSVPILVAIYIPLCMAILFFA